MTAAIVRWHPRLIRTIHNGQYNSLREERLGVMLHYDASGTDSAAMAWFADDRCRVSYNYLVLDDGNFVEIAPEESRAWHAGRCKTSDPDRLPYRDANSAFYGVSAATNDRTDVTPFQLQTVAFLCWGLFVKHGWDVSETWRVVTHRSEAVYPSSSPKAGQRGRKTDPEGRDLKNPIFSKSDIVMLLPGIEAGHG